ncbi:MAG: FAD-dependent oxidoreductase [Actinomycetes bacterium]
MTERLVVVGGDAAGMSAASQARRGRSPDDLEIVAFERGRYTSYSACGIPYWLAGDVDGPDALVVRDPDTHRRKYAIDVQLGTEVEGIDLDARRVHTRDRATGMTSTTGFDHLVVATGAVPVTPPLPGVDAAGIYGVQTLEDGAALAAALTPDVRRAVVVGGGYIGLEMAEALSRRGLEVTVVERADEPMSTLDPDMGHLVHEAMGGMGIEVRTGEPVEAFDARDGRVASVVTSGATIPTDLVVLGLGVRPNTAVAHEAGLPVGDSGGLCTDLRMRVTGVDGVWAAGDCVESLDLVSGRRIHVPLGTHANKQGRVAGINLGGGYATFPGLVRTAMTKVCHLEIGRTGLLERDAEVAGFAYVTATVEATTKAGYFPGTAPMTIKMLAEQRTGRLLGAQIVGGEGSAKRIDTVAVALWNAMTVEEVTGLDLAYAPPFSPTWDPVLIAARKVAERLA